jgi:predicted PurR-regulated permease PerM
VKTKFDPSIEWLQQRYPEQFAAAEAQAAEAVQGLLPAVAGGAATLLKDAVTNTPRIMIWLLTIVVVPVFAYYLLVDYQEIHATLESLIPRQHRPVVQRYVEEIDGVLRAWLKGQLTVASVLAIIYAVGLTLLGVPLGLLIGIVGGLSHIVPYMGLITGFVPAAVLSFLDAGTWTAPLMVAGVFLCGQLLETTVISPRIVGKGLGLPPAVVLLAVFVGGELFGFTGLLLALPATAAALVMLRDLRRSFEPAGARIAVAATRRPGTRRRRPRP